MKKFAILFSFTILPLLMISQDEPKFGIKFSGFIKTDIIWDSRQTVDVREGHFLLFPLGESLDPDGKDINAKSSFNFLSIQTRVRGTITGPDALGAKTSGVIEGEFFGTTNGDINGFRLRHAFVKLNWTSTELLVGQTWHPLFIPACYPGVVSFNTGVPFLPFSRNPQIRLTKNLNNFKVILTALSQIDFKSNGPQGPNSKYLRNSAIPSMNINLEYSKKNVEKGKSFLIGIAGNFKRLIPRMSTVEGYKTSEGINSMMAIAYFKIACPKIVYKLAGSYGQNTYDFTMLGGYVEIPGIDTVTAFSTYENISTMSVWTEIMTTGKKMNGGIFLGYSKNLGASDEFMGISYSREDKIDYLYRISPRFVYNAGKFRIAPELEYTVAGYGTTESDATVIDAEPIGNFRFLLGVFYFF